MFEISLNKYDALIFDLDGVITDTAAVHAAAWKKMFDEYLQRRSRREGKDYEPFDIGSDYRRYVDGKPRYNGVRSFLESRGIELDWGSPDDSPDEETVCGLGNRKNRLFREELNQKKPEVFESTVELARRAKSADIPVAVVSSSKNCSYILKAANLEDLFPVQVDGRELARLNLWGKPASDMFIEASRRLNAAVDRSIVFEDAVSGVEAGRRGGFGLVVGIDRNENKEKLKEYGADIVVKDISEINFKLSGESKEEMKNITSDLPSALEKKEEILGRLGESNAIFLDYDGTLTPIVERPEYARISDSMRETVRELAKRFKVAVVSGRALSDVKSLVGIDEIIYSGSHGFEIGLPGGKTELQEAGKKYVKTVDEVEKELKEGLKSVEGSLIERKQVSVAVHYRTVRPDDLSKVDEVVDDVLERHSTLKKTHGKKVYELQPKIDWHKGKALKLLMKELGLTEATPLYIGDDITDENAFRAIKGKGIGIIVRDEPRTTAADYYLENPEEVETFLKELRESKRDN